MTKFDGEEFIYGYPKDQLMLFALACREAGITNEKLHEINFNIEWAVDAVRKEVEEVARKNLDDIVNRITEQTEPSDKCEQILDNIIAHKVEPIIKDGKVYLEQTEPSTDCGWK